MGKLNDAAVATPDHQPAESTPSSTLAVSLLLILTLSWFVWVLCVVLQVYVHVRVKPKTDEQETLLGISDIVRASEVVSLTITPSALETAVPLLGSIRKVLAH
jgi:hypothetical protein